MGISPNIMCNSYCQVSNDCYNIYNCHKSDFALYNLYVLYILLHSVQLQTNNHYLVSSYHYSMYNLHFHFLVQRGDKTVHVDCMPTHYSCWHLEFGNVQLQYFLPTYCGNMCKMKCLYYKLGHDVYSSTRYELLHLELYGNLIPVADKDFLDRLKISLHVTHMPQ